LVAPDFAKLFASIDNPAFVITRVNEALTVNKSGDDITLEGTAAVFGVKNNNNRIYEKDEYLPHLTYLQEKIKRGKLFGELDHPKDFDIALKNVSHVVESLTYDEGSNRVKIRVKLLDTPCGRIAKTIVESGCTVSISSRAAGQIMNEGRVKLHRIFTYDLVAEPGFEEASLHRTTLNESYDYNYNKLFEAFDSLKKESVISVNNFQNISESLGLSESIQVYKINKKNIFNDFNENNILEMQGAYITAEQFNKYTEVVKEKFDQLTGLINDLKSGRVNESTTQDPKLVEYVNYLATEIQNVTNYADYLAEMQNKSIGYSEHVGTMVNKVIGFSNYLTESVNQTRGYAAYLGTTLNEAVNYSNYLGRNFNQSVGYMNYLAESIQRGVGYTEYVGEMAEKGIRYSEYLGKNIKSVVGYANYLGETLGESIQYSSDYLGEQLEKTVLYTEHVAEMMNESVIPSAKLRTRRLLDEVKKVDEGLNISVDESSPVDDIVESVDKILNYVKNNTAKAVLENQYPFLKLLSEDNKSKFYSLDQETKTAIVETLKFSVYTNEAEVLNLMEAVLNQKYVGVPTYIKFMPQGYKELFEAMNDGEKNQLAVKATTFVLNTPYQVKNFWDSYDFRNIQERIYTNKRNQELQKLDESNQGKEGFVHVSKIAEHQRGYSNEYLESLKRRARN